MDALGLRPEFITISLMLGLVGAVLKYKVAKIPNRLIPLFLFGLSFTICAVWGYNLSHFTGGARWVEALMMYGFVHGLVTTGLSTWAWDAFYGAYKIILEKFLDKAKDKLEVGK
jgi:hypothetical protein